MGLFSNIFGKKDSNTISTTIVNPISAEPVKINTGFAPLNLEKGGLLDLTKYSQSLNKVRLAAGWDVNDSYGANYDLDICAYLYDNKRHIKTVYYGSMTYQGIYLDGDNLTGEGEGDDENIYITFGTLPANVNRIVAAIVIYQGSDRHQYFSKIKNAYVRLVDESNGEHEICRYNLTSDGGKNTACVVSELTKDTNGNWSFKAIGDYYKDSISSLERKIK